MLEDLRIGRIRIGKLVVASREAAYNAQDLITTACNKMARVRSGKAWNPLPRSIACRQPGAPAVH
ncbi:hypothetical protein [Xanthomonas campestris]|uniref:hypothetical protein n=1 Tax=Xanthomonas campestris TaxID=339 RepID=UPI002163BC44|nr:hypothetical protein [Xanthomonas campestris]